MKKLIVSSCGTALLTNGATQNLQQILRDTANEPDERSLSVEHRDAIRHRLEERRNELLTCDIKGVRRLSAELNGILGIYEGKIPNDAGKDIHFLLCTDTHQGRATADLVVEWLRGRGLAVDLQRIEGLTTRCIDDFHWGISFLVNWLEDIIPGYSQNGYRVIFNLVGGFKSVQGYLNTLGMFYADEIVYIFEAPTSELIRIPKLPIQLDPEGAIGKNLSLFRQMSVYGEIESHLASGIPESLLDQSSRGTVQLSIWGQAVWNRCKDNYYGSELLPSPCPEISYGRIFIQDSQKVRRDRMILINRRIDQLARFLVSGKKENPKSLDFKMLRGNPAPPSTHECDAWSDKDARRILCHFEGPVLVIDELCPHL